MRGTLRRGDGNVSDCGPFFSSTDIRADVGGKDAETRESGSEEHYLLSPLDTPIDSYYKKKQPMSDKMAEMRAYVVDNWRVWVFCVVIVACFLSLRFTTQIWADLAWRGWYSLSLVILMMTLLILDTFQPAFVFLITQTFVLMLYYTWEEEYAVCGGCVVDPGSTGLPICGEIDVSRALAGYSNVGVLTVAILFVVAKGIEISSVLKYFIKYVLRKPASLLDAQLRLLIPVTIFSAFLNNTPIVAMMIPVIESWVVQCKIAGSYLFIPLSYAAIMGGTFTIIGCASNVIVLGLVEADPNTDETLSFFTIGYVGVPAAIIGLIYIVVFSRWLLPDSSTGRKGGSEDVASRQIFTVPILVTRGSDLIGKSLLNGGLSDLEGVTILKVATRSSSLLESRENSVEEVIDYTAYENPDLSYIVKSGDIIYFSGNWEAIQNVFILDGVVPATQKISQVEGHRYNRCIVHVVLSKRSEMIGMTVKEADFIGRFNSAVVAMSRQDLPVIINDLDDVVLEAGDVLVLEATLDFKPYFEQSHHFALISEKRSGSLTPRRVSFSMFFVCALVVGMIALSAAEILTLLPGGFIVSTIYILTRILTWEQAKDSVSADVIFIIASAFGLGNALADSCAADAIARSLLAVFSVGGQLGVLFGLYIAVALMTAVISSAASVTLMYPIAVNFSRCTNSVSVSFNAAIYVLMLAGSASFATPISFQTNLMVMGPGNYSTKDFFKFGFPLTLVNMVVVCVLSWLYWKSDCPVV